MLGTMGSVERWKWGKKYQTWEVGKRAVWNKGNGNKKRGYHGKCWEMERGEHGNRGVEAGDD